MGLGERQRQGCDSAKCKEHGGPDEGDGPHTPWRLLTGGPGRPGNPSSPSRPGTPSSPFIPWTPGTPGCPRSPGKELHENLPIPGPPDCQLSQEGLSHGELTFGGYCSGVSLDSLGSRKSSDAWGSLWTEIHGCLFHLQLSEDLTLHSLWAVACSKELSTMLEQGICWEGDHQPQCPPSGGLAWLCGQWSCETDLFIVRINKSSSGRTERENLESTLNARARVLRGHGQELVDRGVFRCLELKKDPVWILRLSN